VIRIKTSAEWDAEFKRLDRIVIVTSIMTLCAVVFMVLALLGALS